MPDTHTPPPDSIGSVDADISLTDDYLITYRETVVGHMEILGRERDTIANIEIDPAHRRNGYAQAATQQFITDARKRGLNEITTTVVVSPTYERILRSLGFEPFTKGGNGHYYALELR